MSTETVTGYKATNADMQCRGFQFKLGEWHKHDGKIAMCESGFHFCEYPSGPWSFYSNDDTRIFKVEARGVIKGDGPGADLKHVAMEIRLVEEIIFGGYRNTGYRNTGSGNTGSGNTGYRNTGYRNTGDRNTGSGNTGYRNTGDRNTGSGNTGDGNTGYRNTGYRNTGSGNTGDGNTGDRNTGDGNTGDGNAIDRCSGYLCMKEPPIVIFDKKVSAGTDIPYWLINNLAEEMMQDKGISGIERYLEIPNATVKKIKALHQAHINRRAKIKKEQA